MIRLIFIDDRTEVIPDGTEAFRYHEGIFSEGVIPPDTDSVLFAGFSEARKLLEEADITLLTQESCEELAKLTDAFVRCISINKVFCPMGIQLYKKSEKKNGIVRYCNKHQCRICEKKCFDDTGNLPFKEVDFSRKTMFKVKKEKKKKK